MGLPLEDYGLLGDTQTAALVGRNGCIDWLCLPRFDSDACFARLLGDEDNGFWEICPDATPRRISRSYRGDSLVLCTEFETDTGVACLVDCMPVRQTNPVLIRVVEGVSGHVDMRMELVVRFGYGSVMPWVRRVDGLLTFVAGPGALALWTPIETRGEDFRTVAEFSVREGQRAPFTLTYYPSEHEPPRPHDAAYVIHETVQWWQDWADRCTFEGKWRDEVIRSLVTLKALTYEPTGGIVAAATTSLPEALGGERNWDYRYCWLRDATLTLSALMVAGYYDEARAWRDWLLRAVAGDPADLQIMYGPAGERRLPELELPWLSGYEGSTPVRMGNAAANQYQLDVYGEVMSALDQACAGGLATSDPAWSLQKVLLDFIETGWREPDDGIWEVRGPRRHFTHSKVMAWVAMDRAVRGVEHFGLQGPVDKWRRIRQEIHDEVLEKGWDAERRTFTQYYGSKELDASLLMIPLFGFLPATDERVRGTVDAIQRELLEDGFVLRYQAEGNSVDGLTGREGAFIPCSFWLADNLVMMGRLDEGRQLVDRLLGLQNDLGLLSEEYDVRARRLVGNFPQAFSHVSLINSVFRLAMADLGNRTDAVTETSHQPWDRGERRRPSWWHRGHISPSRSPFGRLGQG